MTHKLRVVENTYPVYPNVPHAEPGDIVKWVAENSNKMKLVRVADGKTVFSVKRASTRHKFKHNLVGVVYHVKKHNHKLVIEEVQENV